MYNSWSDRSVVTDGKWNMQTFAQKPNQPHKSAPSSSVSSIAETSGPNHHENSVPHLQRSIGTLAAPRMLRTHAEEPIGAASPRFGHDFNRIPIQAPGAIQTKLEVNQPGDAFELPGQRDPAPATVDQALSSTGR